MLGIGLVFSVSAVNANAQMTSADETRRTYLARCAMCHGQDGVPKPIAKGAPNFTDVAWTRPADAIVKSITDGKGDIMPKFKGKIAPEEIRALAELVLKIKDAPPAIAVDAKP